MTSGAIILVMHTPPAIRDLGADGAMVGLGLLLFCAALIWLLATRESDDA